MTPIRCLDTEDGRNYIRKYRFGVRFFQICISVHRKDGSLSIDASHRDLPVEPYPGSYEVRYEDLPENIRKAADEGVQMIRRHIDKQILIVNTLTDYYSSLHKGL